MLFVVVILFTRPEPEGGIGVSPRRKPWVGLPQESEPRDRAALRIVIVLLGFDLMPGCPILSEAKGGDFAFLPTDHCPLPSFPRVPASCTRGRKPLVL
jgi:hypothetical protein